MKGEIGGPYSGYHGKTSKHAKGYHYEVGGQHYYRERKENYQQNQSPRQKWNSLAFKYAHQQLQALNTPEGKQQMEQAWSNANKLIGNMPYKSASKWQFNIFIRQWKSEHPFEEWYSAYLAQVSATAEKKTASESTSQYMIKKQIKALHAQLLELEKRLEE